MAYFKTGLIFEKGKFQPKNNHVFWWSLFLFVNFITFFLQAQVIRFKHITTKDGLSNNSVRSIYQDKQGFIWFGTENGLNRYDGYNMRVYKHQLFNNVSISDNFVSCLFESHHVLGDDSTTIFWVGTHNGLNRFDITTEEFTRYSPNLEDLGGLSDNMILSIAQDEDGILWFGTSNGLNKFNIETGKWQHFFPSSNTQNAIGGTRIQSLYHENGKLWIGHDQGLDYYDTHQKNFKHFRPNPWDPQENNVVAIEKDSRDNRNFWIATNDEGGVYSFIKSTGEFIHLEEKDDQKNAFWQHSPSRLLFSKQNQLWVATQGGGISISQNYLLKKPLGINIQNYVHTPNQSFSLSSNHVWAMYEDRTGIIWVATNNGVNKYIKPTTDFYQAYKQQQNSLDGHIVRSILKDRSGDIWVSTLSGSINQINTKTGKTIHHKHNPNNLNSLPKAGINTIYEDANSNLWFGSWGRGLTKLDRKRNKYTHYINQPNTANVLSDNVVMAIYQHSKTGTLWIGSEGGLSRFDEEDNQFINYRYNANNPEGISNNYVQSKAIYEDKLGHLWIGTFGGGLNFLSFSEAEKIDPKKVKFQKIRFSPDASHSLSSDRVLSICETVENGKQIMWASTFGDGFNKIVVERIEKGELHIESIKQYTTTNGLPGDVVYGILADDMQNLWLSTNNGLANFNTKTETFRVFTKDDGIQGNEFFWGAYTKSSDGLMFFGGANGFNSFYPQTLQTNLNPPPIVLTDFKIFNQAVFINTKNQRKKNSEKGITKNISQIQKIILPYYDNMLSFEFAALDYSHPKKNQYAYKMEGLGNDGWIYSGNRHFATYTNLSPGEYTFRIKGANSDAVWNQKGHSIQITITPPFWQTWWAYVTYILFVIVLIYNITHFRSKQLKKRNFILKKRVTERTAEIAQQNKQLEAQGAQLKALDSMKSRFFANISHEFRTPLTLIQGPLTDIYEGRHGKLSPPAHEQLGITLRNTHFLRQLIDQILDLSKLEAGKLTLRVAEYDIVAFLKFLIQSFKSLSQKRNIHLSFESQFPQLQLYFDKDKLEKIMYNLIGNALKFTPEKGRVKISLTETNKGLIEISVEDTGVGIEPAHLPNVFERFYQSEAAAKRGGTGIGLAFVKELVTLHGGKVGVESSLNQGSRFYFTLQKGMDHLKAESILAKPITTFLPPKKIPKKPVQTAVPISNGANRPTVLIVEDDADMQTFLKSHLSQLYHCESALNGLEGLEKARRLKPDIILSDVMMPEMDGFALGQKLKEEPELQTIPLILLTARVDEDDLISGLNARADAYMTKPFNPNELRLRIRNLLEERKQLEHHYSQKVMAVTLENLEINSADQSFLKKLYQAVEQHIAEPSCNVQMLVDVACLSERQLRRKLKTLTGLSPLNFIRKIRLNHAHQLLEKKAVHTIAEATHAVGFENPRYFSRLFKAAYGQSPSDLIKK